MSKRKNISFSLIKNRNMFCGKKNPAVWAEMGLFLFGIFLLFFEKKFQRCELA